MRLREILQTGLLAAGFAAGTGSSTGSEETGRFAIAQMQVMQSMGFNASFVFGYNPGPDSGHEVTEVWSNQYAK